MVFRSLWLRLSGWLCDLCSIGLDHPFTISVFHELIDPASAKHPQVFAWRNRYICKSDLRQKATSMLEHRESRHCHSRLLRDPHRPCFGIDNLLNLGRIRSALSKDIVSHHRTAKRKRGGHREPLRGTSRSSELLNYQ